MHECFREPINQQKRYLHQFRKRGELCAFRRKFRKKDRISWFPSVWSLLGRSQKPVKLNNDFDWMPQLGRLKARLRPITWYYCFYLPLFPNDVHWLWLDVKLGSIKARPWLNYHPVWCYLCCVFVCLSVFVVFFSFVAWCFVGFFCTRYCPHRFFSWKKWSLSAQKASSDVAALSILNQ